MRIGSWKTAALALACACALVAPAAAAERGERQGQLERSLLGEINELRAAHGLDPLGLSARLSAAADAHSRAMVAHGFFAHSSRNGTSFSTRVRRWYRSRGYSYWAVGENLLWASPSVTPEHALAMWLESPPHRKILLTPKWEEIGLSAVHAVAAPGVFEGLEVTVITADFGVRR